MFFCTRTKIEMRLARDGEKMMLKLLSKTRSWIAMSFLITTPTFATDPCAQTNCPPSCPKVCPDPFPEPTTPAYNAPDGINTRCSWDVFASGSFIYWQPILENMDLGFIFSAEHEYGPIFNMKFRYKPGFKVALGMLFDRDNWSGWAEYTRFHGHYTHAASVGLDAGLQLMQLHPELISFTGPVFDLHRKWGLNMDLLDLLMGRDYYVGTKLSFNTYFGARAAWIRQTLSDFFSDPTALILTGTIGGIIVTSDAGGGGGGGGGPTPLRDEGTVSQNTRSWGVGPRIGTDLKWDLGYDFRLVGNAAGDLLYTRYTRLKTNSTVITVQADEDENIETITTTLRTLQKNLAFLRAHVELEMGLGWGTYFGANQWHFDLEATYGFQVYFNQNMFRLYFNGSAPGVSFVPCGDLFIHGLNLTARFDF